MQNRQPCVLVRSMGFIQNLVNCLEIDIPDAVMAECSRIDNGQQMELHGICVKKGSARAMKKNEAVIVFAERKSASVVFSLHFASMGNIFQKKLSGIWSCQIHTTNTLPHSPNPDRNDDREDITLDPVHAPETSELPKIDPDPVKQEFHEIMEEDADDPSLSTNFDPSQEEIAPPTRIVSIDREESNGADSFTDFCDSPARTIRDDGDSTDTLKLSSTELDNEDDNGESENNSDGNNHRISPKKSKRKRDIRDKPHACTKCNKRFISKYLLDRHKAVHDPDKGMQCPFCPRQFKLKYQLDSHVKTHTGAPSTLSCDICDKKFNFKSALEVHMRLHSGDNPYACETCGEGFRTSTMLAHHRWVHTGEKPFKCETCSKGFRDKSALNAHERVHTGERPYMCPICGKTFRDHSAIFFHKRVHTEEKPYECAVCGKTYKHKSRLKDHSTMHSAEKSFFCEICGMGFWRRSNLAEHKHIHKEKKKYRCSTCGREFRTSSHLKVHIRQHTGEKPYACDLCDKSYKQSALLIRHKRLYHPTTTS